jgi:hypothetical protein
MCIMKTILSRTLIVLAVVAAGRIGAQAVTQPAPRPVVDKAAESRQATRCATFYVLMSKLPSITAEEKDRLRLVIDGLGQIATWNGSTKEEVVAWAREFVGEASQSTNKPKSTFNQDQAKICEQFLASRGATLVPAQPAEKVAPARKD